MFDRNELHASSWDSCRHNSLSAAIFLISKDGKLAGTSHGSRINVTSRSHPMKTTRKESHVS